MTDIIAASVVYSGRVQGVGFRATVAEFARTRPVTGWVKNRPDGRVELLAEGPRADVEAFLAAIDRRFAANIHAASAGWPAATGAFAAFDVVY